MLNKKIKLLISFIFTVTLISVLSFSVSAFDLSYSGGSVGGSTGATGSSSGYTVAYTTAWQNVVGYRFTVVDGSGNTKTGSHSTNLYLAHINSSAQNYQKFVCATAYPISKRQLQNGVNVSTTSGYNTAYEYTVGNAEFATVTPQNPADMSGWIQDNSGDYQNLYQIYKHCGLKIKDVTNDDHIIIEPLVNMKLAGVQTVATPTELAMYGANVSGGGDYNGSNGNLRNAGSSSLWNLQYYVNREFPRLLYVPSDTTIYLSAPNQVGVTGSGRYTYNQIINYGLGCSVLKVTSVVPAAPKTSINFNGNGATAGYMASFNVDNNTRIGVTNQYSKTNYKFIGWQMENHTTNQIWGFSTSGGGGWINRGEFSHPSIMTDWEMCNWYVNKRGVEGGAGTPPGSEGHTYLFVAVWEYDPALTVFAAEDWKGTPDNLESEIGYGWNMGGLNFSDYHVAAGYPQMGDKVCFNVKFNAVPIPIRVRQYVNHGGNWKTRDIVLDSSNDDSLHWFVNFDGTEGGGSQPTILVEDFRQCYGINVKMDWIDENGNVLKSGGIKSFYFPVQPVIHHDGIKAYDINGDICATAGNIGNKNAVYVGQCVNFGYGFHTDNTWSPQFYIRAMMYNWNGVGWIPAWDDRIFTGGADLYLDNVTVCQTLENHFSDSWIGKFRVPDNSNTDGYDNRIPVKFWTHWSTDIGNTAKITYVDMPVIKADAAVTNIQVFDSETNTPVLTLIPEKTYYPVYTYQNNTNVAIFVDLYSNANKISSVVKIAPNDTYKISGQSFKVEKNAESVALNCSIYLEGADYGNTSWESEGGNNSLTKAFPVGADRDLSVSFIEPNSNYRAGSTVISTFRIKCDGDGAVLPSDKLSVALKGIYTTSAGVTKALPTEEKTLVVPGNADNIVYFKWTVPVDCKSIKLTATANPSNNVYETDYNNNSCSITKDIASKATSITANTKFQKSRPADWYYINPDTAYIDLSSLANIVDHKSSWSEWIFDIANSKFIKKTYNAELNISQKIKPEVNTEHFAKEINGKWQMQSGYAFQYNGSSNLNTNASSESYVLPQNGNMYLPDYKYSSQNENYCTLECISSGIFELQKSPYSLSNQNTNDYRRIQFTELWYPDKEYAPITYLYDCWTPAGMISLKTKVDPMSISGSMYDNWYLSHAK